MRGIARGTITAAVTGERDRPVLEVLLVFSGVAALAGLMMWLPGVVPGLEGYSTLIVGGGFLLPAVWLARRSEGGMRAYGIDLAGLLTPPDPDDERPAGPLGLFDLGRAIVAALPSAARETLVGLGTAAVIFPPFIAGYYFWFSPSRPFSFIWPDGHWEFALTQLLVVALPEEAFFRGYVQTRLSDRWPPRRWLGVDLDPRVLLLQAALFALVHFVAIPDPSKFAVFFPALVFGVLRATRGGIGAAMLFHALCNLLEDGLRRGWLTG